jgi:hypothetical protein
MKTLHKIGLVLFAALITVSIAIPVVDSLSHAAATPLATLPATPIPPEWIPAGWLATIGFIITLLQKFILNQLKGIVAVIVSAVIALIVTIVAGVLFLHLHTVGEFFQNFAVLWAAGQFFYWLIVKPVAKNFATKKEVRG